MYAQEERARRTGKWGAWEAFDVFPGEAGDGWCAEINKAWKNDAFAVLIRPLYNEPAQFHLAIRTYRGGEPRWPEMQRIKTEVLGAEWAAVQVYPRECRIIDQADMFHLWCYAPGHQFGFGLRPDDRAISTEAPGLRDEGAAGEIA